MKTFKAVLANETIRLLTKNFKIGAISKACNQKATIIQFQKLKEKAKTEEPKKDIQDLIDFVAEYKDPDNYRWFFWESWLDIDMHRAEGENSFIDAMKSQLEDMAMEAMMDLSCLGYCLGL